MEVLQTPPATSLEEAKEEDLEEEGNETRMIMAALSTLPPPNLTTLTFSILSLTDHRRCRLSTLLTSPTAFSLTLAHLHSLSLPQKTHLIAKHLLSSLHHLTSHFSPPPPPPPPSTSPHRDLDAALLLLLLCDLLHHHPDLLDTTPYEHWRLALICHCADSLLSHCEIGVLYGGVLTPYVELVARCWRFVMDGGGGGKAEAPAAPAVEVRGGEGECVVCKEVMEEAREVCELPCRHLFHWSCILPWLIKRNTCPFCRFELPTEDVHGEIRRLWSFLVKIGGGAAA